MNAAVSESDVLRGADQTRLRILAATRALYASRGTKGTTTREVAISAGVNEATLFRHFGTKQQLVDAMLEYYGRLETPWQSLSHLTAYPTIEEQLVALGTSAIESMLRKQDLMRMTMAEELTNPGGTSCAWQAPSEARRVLVEFSRIRSLRASCAARRSSWPARSCRSSMPTSWQEKFGGRTIARPTTSSQVLSNYS